MKIKLMGTVTVEHDGAAPRHLSSTQVQTALARLVLDRAAGTSREGLADTLWPGELPDTWAAALRGVVSRVRTAVADPLRPPGATPLVARAGSYLLRLPDDAVVDLEQAERTVAAARTAYGEGAHAVARRYASEAAGALRGSFLPSAEGDWAEETRERLAGQRLTALELASRSAAALGDAHESLRWANEAVRSAPLRESAHRCRIAAHAGAGNRAEALRAYHEVRTLLAEEMGIDPDCETQALYLDLLRSSARPARPAPRRSPRRLPAPDLLGAFETPPALAAPAFGALTAASS
ncbi:bacterial transcriptional activator domain-containing protein [Streptomyces sp. NPDC047315]|uniref:AfsR/SARP family transcriptional regulator n=1 Tax=Streptomyces sp. NPDC047315 TaxID=3155142 RepID=UPI0033C0B49E